ncbi:MAG TPA: hypothetical protein VLD57_09835 [Blastocatellia bacterium]|nr:hypothetical protein [Blastocatellia bacterium]
MSDIVIKGSSLARSLARYNIDLRQVKTLLGTYLKQDLRNSKSTFHSNKGDSLTSNRALMFMFLMYAGLGTVVGMLAFSGMDLFTFSVIALSYTLFIVALALVAESGSVFFNESDVEVLGHLPISSRTHFAAKVINLLLFTFMLAAAANLVPLITGGWASGSNIFFIFGHALSTALVSVFAISLIVVCYGLLIKHVSKERFDNFVAYAQAGLALFFILGYQIMPRLIDSDQPHMAPQVEWYHFFYPPAWFSAITLLAVGRIDIDALALSAIGIASVAAFATVAMRKMAVDYSGLVAHLAFQSAGIERRSKKEAVSAARSATARRGLFQAIKDRIVRDPVERAVFDLISVYLKRNREVKVRVYPSIASFLFIPIAGLLSTGLNNPFEDTGPPLLSFMSPQMICFGALTVIEALVFSEHHDASYIFRVTPVGDVRRIYSGFRKAIALYIVVPGFMLLFILFTALWGNPVHVLLLIVPWIALSQAALVAPFIFREVMPLSRKYQKGQQSARNTMLFMTTFIGFFGIIVLQLLAAKGVYPYWLFLAAVFAASPLIYWLGIRLSGARQNPEARI